MRPYNNTSSKKEQIRNMFDRIAPRYDTLNHMLSFGIDRRWRKKTVKLIAGDSPKEILDLATGTGDLAIELATRIRQARLTGADLSPQMLAIATEKVEKKGLTDRIRLEVTEAEALTFADNSFDAVTVAFGVRNFHDIPQGIKEIMRVTRPGGRIAILEFSIPRSKIFGPIYRFYFHRLLPWVGGIISRDTKAYHYLPGSVDEFPPPDRFLSMLRSAGATACRAISLTGGVAYIYTVIKPPMDDLTEK